MVHTHTSQMDNICFLQIKDGENSQEKEKTHILVRLIVISFPL